MGLLLLLLLILDTRASFEGQLKRRKKLEEESSELEKELEHLKSCFIKSNLNSQFADCYLIKAQDVVRAAGQRLR